MIETRRRARTRDGVHRRAALPPLMRGRMTATSSTATRSSNTVKDDLRARIKPLGRAWHHARARHDPRRRRPEQRTRTSAVKRENSAESGSCRATSSCPRSATQADVLAVIDDYNTDPECRRVHRPGPVARRSSTTKRALLRDRPGQGRRRPAPGQPRPARDRRGRPASVHAARHPGAARALQRADRRPARRHRRARSHDRPSARECCSR